MESILVVITMDCERPRSETHAKASGPPDYATSEPWVRAYVDVAREHGFPVTFFLHPEVAIAQAGLYGELEDDGACLGLHLHPWRLGEGRYCAELGGLDEDTARTALSEAVALWQHGLGRRPLYFRPGAMSANDATFGVLADLGFRGGSLSMPGRVYPDVYAIWTGAVPDPHRAHRVFRHLEGDLDFVEMPVSVDLSRILEKNGRWYHWDLRPDFADADYRSIADRVVAQLVERRPAVPVINMVTHNDHNYTDPDEPVSRNYRIVLREIARAIADAGLRADGATLERVCDLVLARPVVVPEVNYASGKVIYEPGELREIDL